MADGVVIKAYGRRRWSTAASLTGQTRSLGYPSRVPTFIQPYHSYSAALANESGKLADVS
jgi:hypothetical protein